MTNGNPGSTVFGTVGAVALAAAVFLPGWAQAAPKSVEDIVNYKGADRQKMLEAGAKKEGSILVYATSSQTQPIYAHVGKIYPFLKVEVYPGNTNELTRRITEEYKANNLKAGSIETGIGGLKLMLDQGILTPFNSPELNHVRKDAIEANRNWVILHESHNEMAWNTKQYSIGEVPKTWDDLLLPKWKGKFAISGRGSTMTHWIGVMALEKGDDFVRKLAKTADIAVYSIGGRGLSNLVVSGEVGISPSVYSTQMRASLSKGASVAWRDLGAVFANSISYAVPKTSPSPHAAMLVLDFLLSKEGQKMRQDLGYVSTRPDMVDKDRGMPSKIYHLDMRPDYDSQYKKWSKLKKVFGKAKKAPKSKKKK